MSVLSYPPKGCVGRNDCKACRRAGFTFRCRRCWRKRPWCVGAADAHPNICDDCRAKTHPPGKRCKVCDKHDAECLSALGTP